MSKDQQSDLNRIEGSVALSLKTKCIFLLSIAIFAFLFGMIVAKNSEAAQTEKPAPKIIYPKNSKVDFDGLTLQGELRNPGEFYFQRKPDEKFDSLVKRRKNFHKEMLRDVVISK